MTARSAPDGRVRRPIDSAIQSIVATSGVLAWGFLLSVSMDTDTTTWLVTLVVVEAVPLLLLANHTLAGFGGDRASGRSWAWALASTTWLPPLAVAIAYPYLEAADARRRPNPYGIITDPPREPSEHR